MSAPGTIQREIERQCAIGAGTCDIDTGHIGATGLLTVNACLDIATLEKASAGTALYYACKAFIDRYDHGLRADTDYVANKVRAALSLARGEAK